MKIKHVFCLIQLLQTLAYIIKYRGKQCGPRLDCSSDMRLHCLTKRFLYIGRRQQQTTFVVIGALRG